MYPHKYSLLLSLVLIGCTQSQITAQKRPPIAGRIGVVVDERLSALRASPDLSGKLIRRLGRGRFVSVRGWRKNSEGVIFYRVSVSSRTQGWIQREAIVSPMGRDEDKRLTALIEHSSDFDRIARARIFLDVFPRSTLRPKVLLLFGDAAEKAALRLTRDANRRITDLNEAVPLFTYFLNYSGLDRYNRQGIRFVFDRELKQFRYDGAAWQEVIRRYPTTPEAATARERLERLTANK
jgi:hypothetical protein